MTNYEQLTKITNNTKIADYMKLVGATGDNYTAEDGMNFIPTKLHIFIEDGKKKKVPCYLRHSGIEYPYSVWGQTEVNNHIQFLNTTKKPYNDIYYNEDCNDWIVLPNNCDTNDNIVCLDIDDKEEIQKLIDAGLPIDKLPFTLSASKKLPHVWFRTDRPIQQINGKKRLGRDIDLVRNYVYERKSNIVYNPQDTLPTLKVEDLAKYLNIEVDTLTEPYNYKSRKHTTMKKTTGVIVSSTITKNGDYILDIANKKFEPTWETIPYTQLCRIFEVLPVEEYKTHSEWFKIVRVVIAMITPESNPNDYLAMFNMWVQKSTEYKPSYEQENLKLFIQILNENSFKNFTIGKQSASEWLYNEIKKHNRPLWLELAFLPSRHIDPVIFDELSYEEAVEVFNKRVGYIGSGINQYVEYNHEANKFIFYKKQMLEEEYGNLYSIIQVPKVRKGQVEMDEKQVQFIKKWLVDKNRKTYKGGCVFKPPPDIIKNTTFNLFTGFEIENQEHFYDNQIDSMNKEALEKELEFMLQHLKYLSGEDKTEEVYQYNLFYFAHLLKYPAVLPRVALVWTSIPGVGKNQWLNFIKNIIGQNYYLSTANTNEVLGNFNTSLRGKLLVNFNEFKQNSEQTSQLKEVISEEWLNIREKHKGDMDIKNCGRYVMTTNDKKSIQFEFKIRRYNVNRCNPITASDHFKFELNYGQKLHANASSIWVQKCFLAYCRKYVDVPKNYNFETNRVITDEFLLMRSRNIPWSIRFIRYLYDKKITERMTGRQLYNTAKHWLEEEGEKFSLSLQQINEFGDNHSIRLTDQTYLQQNQQAIFHNPTYKQKAYRLDMVRAKEYLKAEFIEVVDFIPSDTGSSEEYSDEEDE